MPDLTLAWHEGWSWLGGSVLVAALCANLAWFFRQPRPGVVGDLVARLATWRFSPWLLQLLRLLYYIGVPFAALLWGHDAVVGRLLGVQPFPSPVLAGEDGGADVPEHFLDWAYDAGWAVALGIGVLGLLALSWWTYRRSLVTAGVVSGEGEMVDGANSSGWVLLREAAYQEVHWAFYREPFVVTWGIAAGCWLGVTPVLIELALNVMVWEHLHSRDASYARRMLVRGGLLVASTQLYLKTQNLWLAILMDCVIGSLTLRKRGDQSVTREAITTIL